MIKVSHAAFALVAIFGFMGEARAAGNDEAFGKRGRVVVALDNLGGILRERFTQLATSNRNADSEVSLSRYGSSNGFFAYGPITRLGAHVFATDHVSLGGGLHYSEAPSPLTDGDSVTILGFSPRIGFSVQLSRSVALWMRGGVTFFHFDYGRHIRGNDLMIGGEVFIVARVSEHFDFTIGPTAEIGLAGGIVNDSGTLGNISSTSQTRRSLYGIAFGFAFDF